jgi:hypothetical protein
LPWPLDEVGVRPVLDMINGGKEGMSKMKPVLECFHHVWWHVGKMSEQSLSVDNDFLDSLYGELVKEVPVIRGSDEVLFLRPCQWPTTDMSGTRLSDGLLTS